MCHCWHCRVDGSCFPAQAKDADFDRGKGVLPEVWHETYPVGDGMQGVRNAFLDCDKCRGDMKEC